MLGVLGGTILQQRCSMLGEEDTLELLTYIVLVIDVNFFMKFCNDFEFDFLMWFFMKLFNIVCKDLPYLFLYIKLLYASD